MAKLRSPDDMMKDYLVSSQQRASAIERDTRIEAADPGYLDQSNYQRNPYAEQDAHLRDVLLNDQGRDLGEHLQDIGAGTLGTVVGIGNTFRLAGGVAGDAIDGLTQDGGNDWSNTQEALQNLNDGQEFTNSLKSEKSHAFSRITQYREQQAIDQAQAEGDGWLGQQAAAFGAAASSYIDNPGQILTEAVAQTPYLLTGGVAKGVVEGTGLVSPLVTRMVARGMAKESAEKLVEMGIVGSLQGTIEGSDTAAQTYQRIMSSTDTFGPGDEAARESAALSGAFKAFAIAGATSTISGTLMSKFELAPFGAKGGTAISRSGDNLVKALQEGFQETIESGTSQYASNIAGNDVLTGRDRVAAEQGVGAAAGQGFLVGAGSTMVTNPRSAVDAIGAPLSLAGKAFDYVGSQAKAGEQRADMSAAMATADSVVANLTTPRAAAAMQQGVQPPVVNTQTTDTPAEEVVLPSGIDTRTQVGLFATGMQFLRGKDMNSHDAVDAFHVLGSVLAAANNIRAMRDGAIADAADTSLSPEDRAKASEAVEQLKGLIRDDQLDKWVADFPMEDIESEMEDLRQNPEAFGSAIAHLAAMNPLKMTDKLLTGALEAKSLPKPQRDSLLLAQELKAAAAELKGEGKPDSDGVSRSMMQTGFPGYKENDSVAGYLSRITKAMAESDTETAQNEFNRLLKFSNFEQGRAAAYEVAKTQVTQDPDSKQVNLQGYYQLDDNGKLDKTNPQFVNKKSFDHVKVVRKDADAIQKMVVAIQKRTGLKDLTGTKAPVTAPAAKPAPTATVASTKPKESAAKPAAKAEVVDKTDPGNLTDAELDAGITALEGKRGEVNSLKRELLTNERDRRIADTMSGTSDRGTTKPKAAKPAAAKPAQKPAAVAAPAATATMFDEVPTSTELKIEPTVTVTEVPSEPSKNHLKDLQPRYPVADDASGTDENDAINHLSQSFTTSDQPGLVSKGEALSNKEKLIEEVGITDESDLKAVGALVGTKNVILKRLQSLLGGATVMGKAKAKMLMNSNVWKEAKAHYLYAAKWSAETGIHYQEDIAQVMAWTGVQHMMDMVNPMSWSNDLVQQMQDTYGSGIREKLLDGWVPLKEQTEQLARKLQANLELRADKTVSVEYTEGTMLALAGRIIESMISTLNYNDGVVDQDTFMTQPPEDSKDAPLPVQWIRMSVDKTGERGDMLFAAARILEDFLPERASTSQALIGKPSKSVNPFYRGSNQDISQEQKKALKHRNEVAHKLSPLMFNLHQAIKDGVQAGRLFGMDPAVRDFPSNSRDLSASQIARKGAYNTTKADLNTILQHMRKVSDYAEKHGMSIHEVKSFFEYEQVTNGRAMTKGTSPQSSKWYRELFAIAQYEVDPSKENRGFRMAAAQGLGVKMDIQHIDESLGKLDVLLTNPIMKLALEAAGRLGEKFDYSDKALKLEADLVAIEALALSKDEGGLGIELSPHAMAALVHLAEYQKGKPFTSSLMYEIDGKTDGPINLMMLMGLSGSAMDMEKKLGLGGMFYDQDGSPISVQDMTEQLKQWHGGSKDLYEIIKDNAANLNPEVARRILAAVEEHTDPRFKAKNVEHTKKLLNATMRLVRMAGLSKDQTLKLVADYERAFSKKSTQAAGYMQGGLSISGDLLNTITEAVSARIDKGNLSNKDKEAIQIFFSGSLGSKKDVPYLNYKPYLDRNGYEMVSETKPWDGKPLDHKNWMRARATLNTFIGSALFSGLVQEIGPQRENMMAAVTTMQIRVQYADHMMRTRYKAKQDAEVAAGNLHPGQALSKKDEQEIYKDIFEKLVPHPLLRNTNGLPVASSDRTNGNPLGGSIELDDKRRIETRYFDKSSDAFSFYSGLTETTFEDPGVSFAALSIMAAGDGSMMTGLFAKMKENVLDMYDGLYMNPEIIDKMQTALNQEVEANWQHDFIGAILTSLKKVDSPEFQAWAESTKDKFGTSLIEVTKAAEAKLQVQHEQQLITRRDINSKGRWVSHMAGGAAPAYFPPEALNSTTLGTSTTDPLLDLAADSLGHVTNDIRKMSSGDVKALLKDHTFENPVLGGLWKVLAPLISDNLTLFMSPDKHVLGEFYQQNERQEMGMGVDGVSIGDRVYIRAINAETLVHELLHATTKNLTATYFAQPEALTGQQREAMKNLLVLQDQFLALDPETLSPHQAAMVEHVQAIMQGLDANSALQEFLAYGLSNYHLQRTLGTTKSVLGKMLETVFNAVKALFGFPNGTQSDSMLAAMFSNFEALTAQATNVTYPVSVEDALNSINPELARSLGVIMERLINAKELRKVMLESNGQVGSATARYAAQKYARDRLDKIKVEAQTRMQGLAASNLFPNMTNDQLSAGEYIQAVFAAGLQFKASDNALLARVVDAVRDAGMAAWRDNQDPADLADIATAQARYDYFFENTASRHDRSADILAMALVNPEFSAYMERIILPRQNINKGSLNNWLDSTAKVVYEFSDAGLALPKDASLADALELAGLRIRQSLEASAKRQEAKPGPYRKLTDKLTEGVQFMGKRVGEYAEARLKLKGNKDWIASGMIIFAGTTNDRYADMLGNMILSLTNQFEKFNPAREIAQEMVGTTSGNFKLIQLKGIAARMISAIRQSFREQVPVQVKSWFKDLTPELDELLHKVIGKTALYTLSQGNKDNLEELLTENGVAHAITDASRLLMAGGDSHNKSLMIQHAKRLGDRMAGVRNETLYLNTRAIELLTLEGGANALTAAERAALEDLSTLQALSHLTPTQRRATLALYRENTEGFWKTTVLINSFYNFDTQRAGQNTATLNFQKGYIPTETDGRKKLKLFNKTDVRAAERMGWVVVPGQSAFKDDANLVYMATEVGKTPTLSGGAIHAVDLHMNGIHFHSGLPTDPSIQTLIKDPKQAREIRARILNGEVLPYSALFDANNDIVGFQRLMDPAMMDRHTKTVGRISDAAGIWLGRLHEEAVAQGQNQAAVNLLKETWDKGKADKRENEFVQINSKSATQDKVIGNVWATLPYHTKRQMEKAFANGTSNPPVWIRRDQLNDAIGYHKAGIGNFFTGDNRYEQSTNTNVAALSRQFLGKNAYKYLVTTEEGWKAVIGSAKDTIIVKSLTVALNNLASNQIQLFMITGNPFWNLRVQAQKHKELVSYLGYQVRIARLTAEGLATQDPKAKVRIDAEQAQMKVEIRKLSIWPLIEAGELPTIAEGLSETEEFSMMGDLTAWLEKQTGKMPPVVGTILNNLAVSKETSLYKGLDRMVQYGDFVAKATMYEWLTTKDKAIQKDASDLYTNDKNPNKAKRITMERAMHEVALREVNDEFVNYARLPGRWRTYGEDMGLLWFFNYKLRIMKMGFRRIRKNPAAFLIGAQVGSVLGLPTLVDTLPGMANFAYSTGLDPLFTAHKTHMWVNLFDSVVD